MTPGITPPPKPPERPADVETGFWLWATALPLMVTGYLSDAVITSEKQSAAMIGVTALFATILAVLVVTFLMLMRSGYRWARTLLTGGAVASIFYTASGLFSIDRPPVGAIVFAVTGIIGAVLIGGGIYLLHRPDAQGFFIR